MNTQDHTADSMELLDDDLILNELLSKSHDHSPSRTKPKTGPNTRTKFVHLSTDESRPFSSLKKGMVSGLMENASKDLDTIKQTFTKIEFTKDQFQTFLTTVREKLSVHQDNFEVVKRNIVDQIDELLRIKKEAEQKDKLIKELQAKNLEYEKKIEEMEGQTTFSSEKWLEFLKNNNFILEKSSVNQILHGNQLIIEEMAPIEKVHIDYKAKKLTVEYLFDNESFSNNLKFQQKLKEENSFNEEKLAGDTKSLLRSSSRLTKRFLKINQFLLYNITNLCRFMKESAPNVAYLNKMYKDLDVHEKTFKSLKIGQEEADKSPLSENLTGDSMGKINTFVADLMIWWDVNYKILKEIYLGLSKGSMEMVNDLQDKLLRSLDEK